MLPIPFINFIPKWYTRDTKLTAFADKHDEIIIEIKEAILALNNLIDPVLIQAQLLDYLGSYLNAGIESSDTNDQKRKKIAGAVASHKKRGSFTYDAKPKIDIICGGNSDIIHAYDYANDDYILLGDGLTTGAFLTSYYWATLGADGIDLDLGIALIGEGTEIEVSGNIYIDVDNNALTAEEQADLQAEMIDIVPAYMYVHFGYLDISDNFIEYFVLGKV